jgi:hypothetical protein
MSQRSFLCLDFLEDGLVLFLFAWFIQQKPGSRSRVCEMGVKAGFIDVVEKRRHLVKVFLRHRIILMVMTTSASER